MRCKNCTHYDVCYQYDLNDEDEYDMCALYEPQRPHGEWQGKPERRKMVTRICTSCGDRSVVGYFCMWCGADMRPKEGDEK